MAVDTEKKVTELAQELSDNRIKVASMQSNIKDEKIEIKKLTDREEEIFNELGVRFSDEPDDEEIPF